MLQILTVSFKVINVIKLFSKANLDPGIILTQIIFEEDRPLERSYIQTCVET